MFAKRILNLLGPIALMCTVSFAAPTAKIELDRAGSYPVIAPKQWFDLLVRVGPAGEALVAKELDERVGGLEPSVRHQFERARKAKGTGTTIVSGRVCAACHRDVPFEDINRVLGGEILPCQSCRRLLVHDPNA